MGISDTLLQRNSSQRGFTLIELLIVVAIIAILAAIAVPNFLEAQMRAKLARTRADMRTMITGLETYAMDHNHYPPDVSNPGAGNEDDELSRCFHLTTPIAYLSSFSLDPFSPANPAHRSGLIYASYEIGSIADSTWAMRVSLGSFSRKGCAIYSNGPDIFRDEVAWIAVGLDRKLFGGGPREPRNTVSRIYDATNGTVSWGDIVRLGGDTKGTPNQF